MEIGLREVLILIGFLVVAGILLDGYRRMRRGRLKMQIMRPEASSGDGSAGGGSDAWDLYRSELPNGGARVVPLSKSPHAGDADPDVQNDTGYEAPFGSAQETEDSQPEMLGSAYARASSDGGPERKRKAEGDALNQSDLFADDDILLAARADQQARLAKATRGKGRPQPAEAAAAPRDKTVSDQPVQAPLPDIQEVLVMNVMARQGELPGADLLRVLLSCGFRFGEMNIFHRYEQHSGKGAMLFSVANGVEPGTFDLDNMDNFSTPGICMFMQLPGPKRPMHAFEIMMDSARKIANLLEADIRDEQHNILRQQTAEHYRQRVLDFERKMLTMQGGQR